MNLHSLFEPSSIAIIGASTDPKGVGNAVVKNLVEGGYAEKIFPVNPKASALYGLTCYPDISQVPQQIELAVIVVPAAVTPSVLEQAAAKGATAAIVISSGFRESGHADLEEQLVAVATKHDIALLGPNCLGVLNPKLRMNASFAATHPKKGPIAFLSQSGALCTAVLDTAQALGLGFSKFVSLGNKAAIDESVMLEYFSQDRTTEVIALYIEDVRDPQKFLEIARQITTGKKAKPIIVLKAGRTDAGASASASHTGSLAGSDAAYDALFRQAGVLRASSISEMFAWLQVLAYAPQPQGKHVAVITNAGGPGVLTTDSVVGAGLEMAELTSDTQAFLRSFLPPAASVHNPVDVLGDAGTERYVKALAAVVSDEHVDSAMVLLTPQSMTEVEATAEAIAIVGKKSGKPIVASFMGDKLVKKGRQKLAHKKIPVLAFPEEAAEALGVATRFALERSPVQKTPFTFQDFESEKVRTLLDEARAQNKLQLPEADAVPIFAAAGFPVLHSVRVHNMQEAQTAGAIFPAPFVMKIVSPDILHKSDVGGVKLGVKPEEARTAYVELMKTVAERSPQARLEGALLAETAPTGGVEVILGAKRDPLFGPVILVGLGGIFVEVLKDVALGVTPLFHEDALNMLKQLKTYPLFTGARGQAALDVDALVDAIDRLATLMLEHPDIQEAEANPLLVLPEGQGVKVLDARMLLNQLSS